MSIFASVQNRVNKDGVGTMMSVISCVGFNDIVVTYTKGVVSRVCLIGDEWIRVGCVNCLCGHCHVLFALFRDFKSTTLAFVC